MSKFNQSKNKSLPLNDVANEIELASQMIKFDARLAVLEVELSLDSRCLRQLYRELKGKRPPGGMLPYSADWFDSWLHNIHASFFYTIYMFLCEGSARDPRQLLIDSYGLYLEYAAAGRLHRRHKKQPILSFTRAWLLLRFVERGILKPEKCSSCGGFFLRHDYYQIKQQFICGICKPPNRVGPGAIKNTQSLVIL